MDKLSFSIQEIQREIQDALFYFDEVVDLSELISEESNDLRSIEPVAVKGFFAEDGKDIFCSFDLESDVVLPCARTLADVPYHIKVEATEIFSERQEVAEEDEEVNVISDGRIQLQPFVREHLLLNIPYRVYSNKTMIKEGEDWSFLEESELEEKEAHTIDPRLKKLQQFYNDENE